MRVLILAMLTPVLLACSSAHPFWRPWTPEEREAEHQQDLARYERSERRAEAEQVRQKQADAVVQAFSLRDVSQCVRLGLAYSKTLSAARLAAVDMGGDRILAQGNRRHEIETYRDTAKASNPNRPVVVPTNEDDWEVYRCVSRSG